MLISIDHPGCCAVCGVESFAEKPLRCWGISLSREQKVQRVTMLVNGSIQPPASTFDVHKHVRNNVAKNQLDFSATIQRQQSQPALLVLQPQESSSASPTSESCHGESSPPNPQGRGGI